MTHSRKPAFLEYFAMKIGTRPNVKSASGPRPMTETEREEAERWINSVGTTEAEQEREDLERLRGFPDEAPPPHLPEDSAQREAIPIATAVLDFFPDAIVELARTAAIGSQQHHMGEPVQWDRSKSADEPDALMRHFMDRGRVDKDGLRHTAKVAWRALAMLQKELEVCRMATIRGDDHNGQ